ncbi:phosphotransferase family protein [Anaerosporobacter sp.]|uniref:phosphotransferase family protein n=1 Tax=Anaerosporobacter sp. TaxID=1872529 RepID=UPI00286F9215|nr:aminoglycoside phosphotransferase family protein [Anaerosporobacter sp.]
MDAVSKFWQDNETLEQMTEKVLGEKLNSFSAEPINAGFVNAVYLICANSKEMILKIASQEHVEMLSDENNLLLNEAQMLAFINEKLSLPIPRVLLHDTSCTICKSPYLFISKIEGDSYEHLISSLSEQERAQINYEIGKITAQINSIKHSQFGRPQLPESFSSSNSTFMLGVFRMLLDDGLAKNLDLRCISYEDLWNLIKANQDAFDDCKQPCLIHNDIWDGNIMVHNGKLSGIIDFERCFWGDYLLEDHFSGYGEISPDFLKGYGKSSFTKMELRRISLYRIWRRLAMTIETPYRQFDDEGRFNWVTGELKSEIGNLRELMKK